MNDNTHTTGGRAAGQAAGSWIIDGNTTAATAAWILAGYDDGDAEVMDLQPAPLSGEWAGESLSELLGDGYTDTDADDYEIGFAAGFWDAVLTAAGNVAQPMSTGEDQLRDRVGIDEGQEWPAHAWPGCYGVAYHTNDGGTFCAWCMNDDDAPTHFDTTTHDGWGIIAADVVEETESGEYCDHCGRTIAEADAS